MVIKKALAGAYKAFDLERTKKAIGKGFNNLSIHYSMASLKSIPVSPLWPHTIGGLVV